MKKMTNENSDIIHIFANSLIVKERKDRICYELIRGNRKGIDRFNHNTIELLRKEKILINCSADEIIVFIKSKFDLSDVFLVIDDSYLYGSFLKREELIKKIENTYMSLIAIKGQDIAIIKGENGIRNNFYVLKIDV